MRTTLKDYLMDARYYLNPEETADLNRRRQQLIEYCYDFNLDKRFQALVQSNQEWYELAQRKPVEFYVQQVRKHSLLTLPTIRLVCWDCNSTPVIEVFTEDNPIFL